jgi:hypothetical protein
VKPSQRKLVGMVPETFRDLTDYINLFLYVLGDEGCDDLYAVCKDYNADEMDFIYLALIEDLSRLPSSDISTISEHNLKCTHQLLLTAAHAAPIAIAFKVLENEKIKQEMKKRGGSRNIRELLRRVGEAINMSRADSLVVHIPNMERHDPVILAGAVVALVIRDTNGCSAELVRYMGKNWRSLSVHSDVIAEMGDFDISAATSLVEGGAASLVGGAL